MREEKQIKLVQVENSVYWSDDGRFSSSNREDVEVYEAQQKGQLKMIRSFKLPDQYNEHFIFRITSRSDFLLYKTYYSDMRKCYIGFKEEDVPNKVSGYFVHHLDISDYYTLTPVDKFLSCVEEDLQETKEKLQQQQEVANILRTYAT